MVISTSEDIELLEEHNEDTREYSLPYGWKKIGHRGKLDRSRWDFYVISPSGKRFRSNPEITRYLDENPKIKCDLGVTNTSKPKECQRVKKIPSLHKISDDEIGKSSS